MNKKIFFLTSILLVVSLFISACGNKSENKELENNKVQKNDNQTLFDGTFKDLLGKGKSLKCDFSLENLEGKISGVAYTDGSRMRQEISFSQGNMNVDSFLLVNDEFVYTWSSMQPGQGAKMDISILEDESQKDNFEEMDQSFAYNCSNWKVNENLLIAPEDVNFIDLSAITGGNGFGNIGEESFNPNDSSQNGQEEMMQQACSACEMAPDPNMCRQNLTCN